jgi:hypothetical protein
MISAVLFTSGYGIVNYLTMVSRPVYASEFGLVAEARTMLGSAVSGAPYGFALRLRTVRRQLVNLEDQGMDARLAGVVGRRAKAILQEPLLDAGVVLSVQSLVGTDEPADVVLVETDHLEIDAKQRRVVQRLSGKPSSGAGRQWRGRGRRAPPQPPRPWSRSAGVADLVDKGELFLPKLLTFAGGCLRRGRPIVKTNVKSQATAQLLLLGIGDPPRPSEGC